MAICFVETIMNIHLLPDKSWAGHRLHSTQRINGDENGLAFGVYGLASAQYEIRISRISFGPCTYGLCP